MTTLFVVPNYFTADSLAPLLDSLKSQTTPDWRVLFVDNSEAEDETSRLNDVTADDQRFHVTTAPSNVGYFNALEIARIHFGGLGRFEQVWLCNPDLTLDPSALETALAVDNYSSGVGVLAPGIISDIEGGDTNPFLQQRPNRVWWWRLRILFAYPLVSRLYVYTASRLVVNRASAPEPNQQNIYAPHGGCVIFLSDYFASGGPTVRREWLFLEEVTIAEACARLSLSVLHAPEIVVHHREHASTGVWRSAHLLRAQRDSIRSIYADFAPW